MTASRESSLAQWFQQVEREVGQKAGQKAGREADQKTARLSPPSSPRQLLPVSGDASFRRYFRVFSDQRSYILMDAPPEHENCAPFIQVAEGLARTGVNVPAIHAVDARQGFMCLSDFGDIPLWHKLEQAQSDDRRGQDSDADADTLYREAFAQLLKIQSAPTHGLPPYDEALLQREMQLFREWFCQRLLGLDLHRADHHLLDQVFAQLTRSALAQPRVCVHRDYHSRNLMYLSRNARAREGLAGGSLGVLDFQDAVHGPVTYDLVSLLRDCYISWPRPRVDAWALEYAQLAGPHGIIPQLDAPAFLRDFHLMGMQRHLKAIGIFARLQLRDGKPGYLQHIPRTLDYVREVAGEHESLRGFGQWLDERVLPGLDSALAPATRSSSGNGERA